MSSSDRGRRSVPELVRRVRNVPADLATVLVLVVLTDAFVLAPVIRQTPVRIVLGFLFALFLPGYAFVSALFPERGRPSAESVRSDDEGEDGGRALPNRSIDGIERLVLSFGTSIATVPLIGLVLNFTPWGIRLVPVTIAVSVFTVIAAVVGVFRRLSIPADERFAVPYHRWMTRARSAAFEPETRVDAVLNVALALGVLLLASSVAYAVVVPDEGAGFTEFYLLAENESGALVASDYPTEFNRSEAKPLVVGIGNHEGRPMNYTVVVELQRVEVRGNSTTVVEQQRLHRFRTRLGDNETRLRRHVVEPTMTGTRLRLAYLLYRDSVPSDPTVENAYREVHLWINVSSPRG